MGEWKQTSIHSYPPPLPSSFSSSFSSSGSTTLYTEFWPSQTIPSIFNPGQGSSSLAILASVYLF
jgi:hypothetical protein